MALALARSSGPHDLGVRPQDRRKLRSAEGATHKSGEGTCAVLGTARRAQIDGCHGAIGVGKAGAEAKTGAHIVGAAVVQPVPRFEVDVGVEAILGRRDLRQGDDHLLLLLEHLVRGLGHVDLVE